MVYVLTTDNFGYLMEGRVFAVDGETFDIESTDGEPAFNVRLSNIKRLDVRPFQRFGTRSMQYSTDPARGDVS